MWRQCAASATRSEDDWSWSTCGNLILVCASTNDGRLLTGSLVPRPCLPIQEGSGNQTSSQTVPKLIWTVVDWVASGISKRHPVINARIAHDFGVSLVHSSVVTLATLAGEMTGICDYLCVMKFGLNTWQWQSFCVPWQSSESAVSCLLRLAPWWWIISLVKLCNWTLPLYHQL